VVAGPDSLRAATTPFWDSACRCPFGLFPLFFSRPQGVRPSPPYGRSPLFPNTFFFDDFNSPTFSFSGWPATSSVQRRSPFFFPVARQAQISPAFFSVPRLIPFFSDCGVRVPRIYVLRDSRTDTTFLSCVSGLPPL